MLLNLPNSLTAARILLIPVFVSLSYLPGERGVALSAACFMLAGFTDWADGYIARRDGLSTSFGKFFDPVADKLLVISALVLLVAQGHAPLGVVLVLISRDITIMALREYIAGCGGRIAVSKVAKYKTGFQMLAILMLLLHNGLSGIDVSGFGLIVLYISAFFSLWSGYDYWASVWPQIRGELADQ